MKKAITDKFFKIFFDMIKQLILTEKMRVSQLNRLGATLQKFKIELDKREKGTK